MLPDAQVEAYVQKIDFTRDAVYGVVNRVFEPAALHSGTAELVSKLLSRSPLAIGLALETIARGLNMSQQEGEVIESDMFGLASTTADMREGMSAFLEKRKPVFPGK